MHLHYLQVDLDEDRRQSKMVVNLKSHAISQRAYAAADGNFHAVWETAYDVNGLRGANNTL